MSEIDLINKMAEIKNNIDKGNPSYEEMMDIVFNPEFVNHLNANKSLAGEYTLLRDRSISTMANGLVAFDQKKIGQLPLGEFFESEKKQPAMKELSIEFANLSLWISADILTTDPKDTRWLSQKVTDALPADTASLAKIVMKMEYWINVAYQCLNHPELPDRQAALLIYTAIATNFAVSRIFESERIQSLFSADTLNKMEEVKIHCIQDNLKDFTRRNGKLLEGHTFDRANADFVKSHPVSIQPLSSFLRTIAYLKENESLKEISTQHSKASRFKAEYENPQMQKMQQQITQTLTMVETTKLSSQRPFQAPTLMTDDKSGREVDERLYARSSSLYVKENPLAQTKKRKEDGLDASLKQVHDIQNSGEKQVLKETLRETKRAKELEKTKVKGLDKTSKGLNKTIASAQPTTAIDQTQKPAAEIKESDKYLVVLQKEDPNWIRKFQDLGYAVFVAKNHIDSSEGVKQALAAYNNNAAKPIKLENVILMDGYAKALMAEDKRHFEVSKPFKFQPSLNNAVGMLYHIANDPDLTTDYKRYIEIAGKPDLNPQDLALKAKVENNMEWLDTLFKIVESDKSTYNKLMYNTKIPNSLSPVDITVGPFISALKNPISNKEFWFQQPSSVLSATRILTPADENQRLKKEAEELEKMLAEFTHKPLEVKPAPVSAISPDAQNKIATATPHSSTQRVILGLNRAKREDKIEEQADRSTSSLSGTTAPARMVPIKTEAKTAARKFTISNSEADANKKMDLFILEAEIAAAQKAGTTAREKENNSETPITTTEDSKTPTMKR